MTYTEMYKEIYQPKKSKNNYAVFTKDESKAWEILDALNDRGGFDHWWALVENEDKDEIFEEIKRIIKAEEVSEDGQIRLSQES